MQKVRRRYNFQGWVQGVGFRFRARRAAEIAGATGWVCNESDGSVTMEIQGTEAQIERVILLIEQGEYIRIENFSVEELPLDPEERSFQYLWW